MSDSILNAPHFHNEAAAYEYVESRIWPNGPVCPHCGEFTRIGKMGGKSTWIGTYKCYDCRQPFTVKIGTIFEASHIKMNVWLQAIYLIATSKKGSSSHQLHRMLGVGIKDSPCLATHGRSAWRPRLRRRGDHSQLRRASDVGRSAQPARPHGSFSHHIREVMKSPGGVFSAGSYYR